MLRNFNGMEDEQDFSAQSEVGSTPPAKPIEWTASEYIAHEKSSLWYVSLVVGSVLVTAIIYLITREVLTAVAIIVVALSAGFFASRPPESKKYYLDHDGLKVDDKSYDLGNFKSFSIVEEGAINSIWLKPLGRFAPFLIIYFDPKDEEKIATMLNYYLPHEQRELDFIDRTMRRLRF